MGLGDGSDLQVGEVAGGGVTDPWARGVLVIGIGESAGGIEHAHSAGQQNEQEREGGGRWDGEKD